MHKQQAVIRPAQRARSQQQDRAAPFRRCALRRGRPLLGALLLVGPLGVGDAASVLAQEAATQETAAQEVAAPGTQLPAPQDAGININTASAQELAAGLSGVGGSRAEAIVRYREQFGPFESIEELSEVSGVGSATIERNRARLRLR